MKILLLIGLISIGYIESNGQSRVKRVKGHLFNGNISKPSYGISYQVIINGNAPKDNTNRLTKPNGEFNILPTEKIYLNSGDKVEVRFEDIDETSDKRIARNITFTHKIKKNRNYEKKKLKVNLTYSWSKGAKYSTRIFGYSAAIALGGLAVNQWDKSRPHYDLYKSQNDFSLFGTTGYFNSTQERDNVYNTANSHWKRARGFGLAAIGVLGLTTFLHFKTANKTRIKVKKEKPSLVNAKINIWGVNTPSPCLGLQLTLHPG